MVAMVIVINSVIGGFSREDLVWSATSTVRLQVSDYSQLSDYAVQLQLYRVVSEISSTWCTNHILEIVMVMVKRKIEPRAW